MRFIIILITIPLLFFSCGGNDTTAPESINTPPEITNISANPNPVSRNQSTTLSVTATDDDGDNLSYAWEATAGTFPSGNTSAQVTWIPPEIQETYLISVTVSDGAATVDTSLYVSVTEALFNLSGQIINQNGAAATSIYVVVTDSNSDLDSTLTDNSGNYSFSNLPEGSVSISLRSSEIIVHLLPRYIEKDTTISLSDDLVANIAVQEFSTIFHDNGTQASEWNMNGGVRNDGTKYIFEDYFLQTDYMMMIYPKPVPSNADITNTYFLIRGEAAPSYSSEIRTNVFVNGVDQQLVWTATYDTTPTYFWGTLQQISGLPGNNIQLRLEFNEVTATYVYVDDIWIFNY